MKPLQRVLHVEDDRSIREVTRVALETLGRMTVLSCNGGAEALEKAADFQPDLILLDVMMPGLDGPGTLEKLREQMDLQGILVLFMTAKVQPAEVERYRRLGAFGVIVKPFNPMTLAQQLQDHWQQFHGA